MNATDDFIDLVCKGHVLASTMVVLSIESLDETPSSLPSTLTTENPSKKNDILNSITKQVIDRFVNIDILGSKDPSGNVDSIHEYARETLSLTLLHAEFQDAIREGDGERVLRVWKFLLPLFKALHKVNYSIEAFNLLAQYYIILPPRLAEQLLWSRFINTHGQPGHNIPCDLHLEHLNRALKTAICRLGANIVPRAVERAGKCIGEVMSVLHNFDHVSGVKPTSSAHSAARVEKDLQKIVDELNNSKVFLNQGKRSHTSSKVHGSIFNSIKKEDLMKWMKVKLYALM